MAGNQFTSHWDHAMAAYPSPGTDILATVTEESLNGLLAKHHQLDRARYQLHFKRDLPNGQRMRQFTAKLDVLQPLRLFLPPQDEATLPPILRGNDGWSDLPAPSARAVLRAGTGPKSIGTVMVYCPEFKLSLTWPRLDGTKPDWSWDVAPIEIGATASLELDESTPNWSLRVRVARIRFSKAQAMAASAEYARMRKALKGEQKALVDAEDQKFYDLLLITLNIAATEFAPRMVASIELPTLPIDHTKLHASMLYMNDKKVTLGSALDSGALAAQNASAVEQHIAAFTARMEMDVENQGGWESYLEGRTKGLEKEGDAERFVPVAPTREQVSEEFPLAMGYVEKLRTSSAAIVTRASDEVELARAAANVAVGVDQYLLATLLAQSLPSPKNKCEPWRDGLGGLVRGRTCTWGSVWGAHVDIAGTAVGGGLSFDFGGRADGCLHVWLPWKWAWEWECASIGIGFTGSPSVQIHFAERPHQGLMFWVDVDPSSVRPVVTAPFPLNVVLQAFASVIVAFVLALVALVVSMVTFQVVPPLIKIRGQNTKLSFQNFNAFAYTNPEPVIAPKKPYIGFECTLTGTS